MEIKSAEYVGSYVQLSQCPSIKQPEFAFIGRSNVGKSSLINLITGRKELAKVSQTPGKTQTINLFLIDEKWHLVDLPGYGYARVSKTTREVFSKMIKFYIANRPQLLSLFVLIDASIPPQKMDIEFVEWLGEMRIPFAILFTKMDKGKKLDNQSNIKKFKTKMLEKWTSLPPTIITSAEKNRGGKEVIQYIQECLQSNDDDE